MTLPGRPLARSPPMEGSWGFICTACLQMILSGTIFWDGSNSARGSGVAYETQVNDALDQLATAIESHLDVEALLSLSR